MNCQKCGKTLRRARNFQTGELYDYYDGCVHIKSFMPAPLNLVALYNQGDKGNDVVECSQPLIYVLEVEYLGEPFGSEERIVVQNTGVGDAFFDDVDCSNFAGLKLKYKEVDKSGKKKQVRD